MINKNNNSDHKYNENKLVVTHDTHISDNMLSMLLEDSGTQPFKFLYISIDIYEDLFSRCTKSIDSKILKNEAFKLIIFYFLSFKSASQIENTYFSKIFDIKEFIESNAELFYFNNDLEELVDDLMNIPRNTKEINIYSQKANIQQRVGMLNIYDCNNIEECYESKNSLNEFNKFKLNLKNRLNLYIKDRQFSYFWNIFMEYYIPVVINLSPNLIIDDIIYKVVDYDYSSNIEDHQFVNISQSTESALMWIYYIIAYKKLQRLTIKYIFDQLVYLGFEYKPIIFEIISSAIHMYSNQDCAIKSIETSMRIKEASDILMSTEQNKSVENILKENIENYSESTKEFIKELKKVDNKNKEIKTSIENYIVELNKSTEKIGGKDQCMINTRKKHDLGKDNVFVLSNLAWEEMIIYFDNYEKERSIDPEFIKCILESMTSLLNLIIEKTGIFFKNRIIQNKHIFNKISIGGCKLIKTIILNFEDISQIKSELLECVNNCKEDNDYLSVKCMLESLQKYCVLDFYK